jgi:hypothetical protein
MALPTTNGTMSAGEKPSNHTPLSADEVVPLWTEHPTVLLSDLTQFVPSKTYSQARNSNALARFVILVTMIRLALGGDKGTLWQGILALLASSTIQINSDGYGFSLPSTFLSAGISTEVPDPNNEPKQVRTGNLDDHEQVETGPMSQHEFNRFATSASEAVGRHEIPLSDETRRYATRPPNFDNNNDWLQNNKVNVGKIVSTNY